MYLTSVSNWLEQVTQPKHPYYYPVQATFFAGISYISTACLTRIPPTRGMTFITLAYIVSQLVTPLIVQLFEPYQNVALVPLIGQVTTISISCLCAGTICNLTGQTLLFKEARQVSTTVLIAIFVVQFAILQFGKYLTKAKNP